ncbi:glycosyltransferase [Paenibacillus sp. sptzw28]|uniref:MGDG synthase family glycosyltransferase n=1 Tax=Paenibacillus sp. sptzw28 TaxID=715179 RepID=UPI001C6EAE83|nr:glycosyltransferase [Paenibacillus sp. sptzw28]QYR19511.1 glycosyltransferase [Paenibacillus sp. sptzw28]
MNRNLNILILYAKFGDGHYQVSEALRQHFLDKGIQGVKLVDLFAEAHPVLNAISRFAYIKSSVYWPELYGWTYSITDKFRPNARLGRWIHMIGVQKLKEIIAREKPDAVIHTFPFLALSELRYKTGIPMMSFTVLTDYVTHSRWIHPETDRYFVASDELKEKMVDRGVDKDRITVSGIPVRRAFNTPCNEQHVYRKYGLQAGKKYVLVMAGAYGVLSDVGKIIDGLLNDEHELLLVCGRNQKLYADMLKAFAGKQNVTVFGFVEHIEELMSVSSCMITKAGGITLSEAMVLKLPVIVYRPLPGQEKGNAEYWAGKGNLQIVSNTGELKQAIRSTMKPEGTTDKFSAATQPVSGNHSANTIVEEVLTHLSNYAVVRQAEPVQQGRQVLHDYS